MLEDEEDLETTEYDIVRARSGILTSYSVERKMRWCGYVFLASALTAPVLLLLPDAVVEEYIGGEPLSTPLTLAGMSLLGASLVAASVAGLFWVAVRIRKLKKSDISREQAWRINGMEGIFGWFALGWGAPLVFVALVAAGTGFQGVEFVESLAERGVDPYAETATLSFPTAYVSLITLVLGLVTLWLSRYISEFE